MEGRFCSLEQTHSECRNNLKEIMQFRPRNRVKTKKKVFTKKLKSFCPEIKRRPNKNQKKIFTAIWDYIRPEFVEFFVLTGPFSSDHPALISRWGGR